MTRLPSFSGIPAHLFQSELETHLATKHFPCLLSLLLDSEDPALECLVLTTVNVLKVL